MTKVRVTFKVDSFRTETKEFDLTDEAQTEALGILLKKHPELKHEKRTEVIAKFWA